MSKLLDVVRDECGVAQEVRALFQRHAQEAPEHSGTWAPDSIELQRTQEELFDEYWKDLQEAHGERSQRRNSTPAT